MAITATITVSPSALTIEQQTTATITVSNSGSSDVTVDSIQLVTNVTGKTQHALSVAYGEPNLGPNAETSVAASGSTIFPVSLVFHAPSPAAGTFDVGAIIKTSDGSITSPTAATCVVAAIDFPSGLGPA